MKLGQVNTMQFSVKGAVYNSKTSESISISKYPNLVDLIKHAYCLGTTFNKDDKFEIHDSNLPIPDIWPINYYLVTSEPIVYFDKYGQICGVYINISKY